MRTLGLEHSLIKRKKVSDWRSHLLGMDCSETQIDKTHSKILSGGEVFGTDKKSETLIKWVKSILYWNLLLQVKIKVITDHRNRVFAMVSKLVIFCKKQKYLENFLFDQWNTSSEILINVCGPYLSALQAACGPWTRRLSRPALIYKNLYFW